MSMYAEAEGVVCVVTTKGGVWGHAVCSLRGVGTSARTLRGVVVVGVPRRGVLSVVQRPACAVRPRQRVCE